MVAVAAVPLLALTGTASAADPWLGPEQSILRPGSPYAAQQAPAVAADPGDGMTGVGADEAGYLVAVASDWSSGSAPATGLAWSNDGGTTWRPEPDMLPHTAGNGTSGGSPSVAWLDSIDDVSGKPTAVVAERGRGPSACSAQGGIYLGTYEVESNPQIPTPHSDWVGNADRVAADGPGSPPGSFMTMSSPAVAVYDPVGEPSDRIHVVYVRTTWADSATCASPAAALNSEIWLASRNATGGAWAQSLVSTISGDAITPAVDVLANGSVVVVWHDRALGAVQSRVCSGGPAGCDAGEKVVKVDDAIGTQLPGGQIVTPAPVVAVSDVSQRIVVAWSEWSGPEAGLDVMSATSKNDGLTFVGTVRANDVATGDQFGASLAAGVRGQVELAFLDGRSGSLLPMASASRTPLPAYGEAWSANVRLSDTPINPGIGAPADAPQLTPHPIAVASLAPDDELTLRVPPVSRHALAVWTDTSSVTAAPHPQSQDRNLHAVVLKHGTTEPTLGPPADPIGKRLVKDVRLPIVDPDGDPVGVFLPDKPPNAIVPNENLPFVTYTAPDKSGVQTLRFYLSDGEGRSYLAPFSVQTFNTPPRFVCPSTMSVAYGKPLSIGACAVDDDHDTVTYSLTGLSPNGAVETDATGWYFRPDLGFESKSTSFTLIATDEEGAATKLPLQVQVGSKDPVKPGIKITTSSKDRRELRGATIKFTAELEGGAGNVSWTFGDKKTGKGTEISHRFTKPGTFAVRATANDGDVEATVTVKIDAPPLEITSLKWTPSGQLKVRLITRLKGNVTAKLGTIKGRVRKPLTITFNRSAPRTRSRGHVLLTVTLKPRTGELRKAPFYDRADLQIRRLVPVPARR